MTPSELRELRHSFGWNQATAAARLGITLRALKYYEAGRTSRGAYITHVPKSIGLAALAYRLIADVMTEDQIERPSDEDDGDRDDDEEIVRA
jgi:transcriptional regulator with XRE-family HTH domain